ncbi:MFS transporter [Salinibacterium sp. ZJ450]|uniref:MFS transporter n=1 Tax=Salinibacterium sp. ZJ450 TaxID=2708338 RepID=UPI00141F60B5|nr:MFS transporter [Salinibacterium sp. ZJ450]
MYISLRDTSPAPKTRRTGARVSSVVITLGIVSMLTDVSSESVSAILPLYITGVIGLSMVAYGFLDGLYQGVSAVVRIGAGWVSDRGDQPKWVAFFGYGLSAIARVGLLIATGFGALTAVITADRIGKGVRTAPRDAMISAASAPDDLGRSFGVHRMLDTVGAALGPLLAFVILLLIPDGYSTVFVVSLAFAVLGLAVLGLMVPGSRRAAAAQVAAGGAVASAEGAAHAETAAELRPRFRWAQLRDPRLRRLLIAAGLLGLLTVGDGFIYLLLQSRGAFAAEFFPLLYVGTNVAFLALAVPLGRLADRIGRARLFVIGHLALLGAYVVAAIPVNGVAITVLCLLLLGAFYAATDGILAALASQFTPAAARATGIASAQTVVAMSRLVASTGFGLLWVVWGRESAITGIAVALALVIPAAALLLATPRRPRSVAE